MFFACQPSVFFLFVCCLLNPFRETPALLSDWPCSNEQGDFFFFFFLQGQHRSERTLTPHVTICCWQLCHTEMESNVITVFRSRPHVHTSGKWGLCQTTQGIPSKHDCKSLFVEVKQREALQQSLWIAVAGALIFPNMEPQNHINSTLVYMTGLVPL